MDITKYLKNKDIELSNDDIDMKKLENDVRKGYVLSDEVETARKEALKESTTKYSELETKYTNLEKSFNDLQEKNVETSKSLGVANLKLELSNQGFKSEDFDKVIKLRSTMYADETDDIKAIESIKNDYGATYFPKPQNTEVPSETNFTGAPKQTHEIKITRNTSIKDLMQK